MGGLGNQLFVWAGAHKLAELYSDEVCILNLIDRNLRIDRPNELKSLKSHCSHAIKLRDSKYISIMLRILDKFQIEKYFICRELLQKAGFYTFENPTAKIEFLKGKPRFVRGYFQRDQYVESVWEQISNEINGLLDLTEVLDISFYSQMQAIHFRRGDTIYLKNTLGVLSVKYYLNNLLPNITRLVCTDDINFEKFIENSVSNSIVLTPLHTNAWQTLKIFSSAKEFLGSNSTLSWWAAKIRSKNGMNRSVLPVPWTVTKLNYETYLNIAGVNLSPAKFEL
jgi:hypothetical protein